MHTGPFPTPLRRLPARLSLAAALLLAATSLAGLLFPELLYPSEALRRSFIPNDVVNLLVGLPILLAAMALARRGRLVGLLFWPGALFYITYNAAAYAIALFPALPFFPNLALVVLSVFAIARLLASVDSQAVRQRLHGAVRERLTGGVLAAFGALFFLLAAGKAAGAISGQAPLTWPELAMQYTDLLFTPAWVAGGVLLWRRRAFGYVTGAGLLFQASMLFVGLLAFFILTPVLSAAPFPLEDFVVVLVMSLVCFIPLGIFTRAALIADEQKR